MRIDEAQIGDQRVRYGIRAGDASRVPLLIFNGLGANIELALPFIDALSQLTVVIFDVPGVGGSPTPRVPYRPATIAGLAQELLDRLGMTQVDVLGVSWGGAIAQQFAFQHASHCRRLVLAATAPGALMVPAKPGVLWKMLTPRRYVDPDYAIRVAGDVYGGAFRHDPRLVDETLRHVRFASRAGYYLQLAATAGWSSLPWLFALRQPTLVMAAVDDPLVPTINARILKWLIPDSRLVLIDCGHLFLITRAAESARIVDDFLIEARDEARARSPSFPYIFRRHA